MHARSRAARRPHLITRMLRRTYRFFVRMTKVGFMLGAAFGPFAPPPPPPPPPPIEDNDGDGKDLDQE